MAPKSKAKSKAAASLKRKPPVRLSKAKAKAVQTKSARQEVLSESAVVKKYRTQKRDSARRALTDTTKKALGGNDVLGHIRFQLHACHQHGVQCAVASVHPNDLGASNL